MQEVHLTCQRARLLPMLDALSAQFKPQAEEVSILDYGQCQKSERSYIVLAWVDDVDETFIAQLTADTDVLDYSVYTVPTLEDDLPFGMELSAECEERAR